MRNVIYIITLMVYYLVESIIIGIPVSLIWNFILKSTFFNFDISYVAWVSMIWIIKIIFFDVFRFKSCSIDDNEKTE